MLRINEIKVPLEYTQEDLIKKCAKTLRIKPTDITGVSVYKKSIDSRKKDDKILNNLL